MALLELILICIPFYGNFIFDIDLVPALENVVGVGTLNVLYAKTLWINYIQSFYRTLRSLFQILLFWSFLLWTNFDWQAEITRTQLNNKMHCNWYQHVIMATAVLISEVLKLVTAVLTVHLCGFSPVCLRMCTTNMYCALNGFSAREQPSHRHTNDFLLAWIWSLLICCNQTNNSFLLDLTGTNE